jgi:hypothetical protein
VPVLAEIAWIYTAARPAIDFVTTCPGVVGRWPQGLWEMRGAGLSVGFRRSSLPILILSYFSLGPILPGLPLGASGSLGKAGRLWPGVSRTIRLRPDERLFGTLTKQNANYRFAKYAKLAGLPKHKRHTHCLRHSRAMHTIRQAGIENVRQLCGHASIASTGYYLKVSDASAWAALGSGAGLG